jgi:integrase
MDKAPTLGRPDPPHPPAQPRLLDRVRQSIRTRHYSRRTEEAYVFWIKRFLVFHGMRHPDEMGSAEVASFLSHLATQRRVSASTQNQAFSAILFLYRNVLERQLTGLESVPRAKRPEHVPLVLSRDEVGQILKRLQGSLRLMAALMYGSGLRLLECARLRVKDIDFERHELTVHDGKGQKDRITVLPAGLAQPLRCQLERVRRLHEQDLAGERWKVARQLAGRGEPFERRVEPDGCLAPRGSCYDSLGASPFGDRRPRVTAVLCGLMHFAHWTSE